MIAVFLLSFSVIAQEPAAPQWQAFRSERGQYDAIQWWAVAWLKSGNPPSSVTYASYNSKEYASAAAAEMNKRKLGPYWHVGRTAQEVIDMRERITSAAFSVEALK